jgi:hypothetical protein
MYTTLIAGIIGVFSNDSFKDHYTGMLPYIRASIVLFVVAGMAGGLIASSIPHYATFAEFKKARLGPWSTKLIPAMVCTHIEHSALWLGCAVAVTGLFRSL